MPPSVGDTETLQTPPSSHFPAWGSSLNLQELQIQGATGESQEVTYLFPDIIALETICDQGKDQYEIISITGFEIYIVEQWACERKYGTVITSFTGDREHEIKVGKMNLPLDTSKWSSKITHFFQEIAQSGAKPKKTDDGFLFITNLSSFPSNLNLLPISCGCVLDTWEYFKVNVNLRRMNCGGRSALLLCQPSDASGDKFRQIYKTHPKIDVMYSVKELVMLVQICLVDFKLLDPNFVDGLLCDKTISKIKEWWRLFGSAYYFTTPKDGLLGPTTVSAILGFVLSCHFRLDIAGSDFPKEPFNYFSFRVNVGKFQKQYNLPRTWYLDPTTVDKLFRVTTKISNTDISKLKKVVKSTVQDISGKGSSIQYAPEVLTLDLDKLIKYFHCSARLSYLWYGKGDVRQIKGFDYHERGIPSSSLRSGVDKIRNLPRKLQDDNYMEIESRRIKDRQLKYQKEIEDEQIQEQKKLEDYYKKQMMKDKKFTTDEAFNHELRRRSSFPFISREINIDQIEYENLSIDRISKKTTNEILKRSKSFSFVENSINNWNFTPSPYTFGERLKILKSKIFTHQLSNSKFQLVKQQHFQNLEKSHNEILKLNQIMKPINRSYELQSQNDERAQMKMEDIQALSARLEYELRVLSTRVRDTEDSVDQFVLKVDSLDHSISESNACFNSDHSQNSKKDDFKPSNSLEICWYSIISRFDIDRLKSLWMKFDPSFGYANWINDKLFGNDDKNNEKKQSIESIEHRNSFGSMEKAKQN